MSSMSDFIHNKVRYFIFDKPNYECYAMYGILNDGNAQRKACEMYVKLTGMEGSVEDIYRMAPPIEVSPEVSKSIFESHLRVFEPDISADEVNMLFDESVDCPILVDSSFL
jgi:hypothetical protein